MTNLVGRALASKVRMNMICPKMLDPPVFDKLNLSAKQQKEIWKACLVETRFNSN